MTRPHPAQHSPWRLGILIGLIVMLVALSLTWAWGPLHAWLDLNLLLDQIKQFGRSIGYLEASAAIALAAVLAVPLGVIIPLAALAFEPVQAYVCLMCGATLGGAASFALGMHLGRASVQRLAGKRINAISQKLARRGVLSVFVIRLLPIAPFAIVNMVAGTTHIRLKDFVLGTLLGMTPGVLLAILLVDRLLPGLVTP